MFRPPLLTSYYQNGHRPVSEPAAQGASAFGPDRVFWGSGQQLLARGEFDPDLVGGVQRRGPDVEDGVRNPQGRILPSARLTSGRTAIMFTR